MNDELAETLNRRPTPRRPGESLETRLVIVHPPALTQVIELGDKPLTLGRQSGPDALALADGLLSRQHLQIRWDVTRHVVADLDSKNGTRLDGIALEIQRAHALSDEAVLVFGDVVAVYERGPEPGGAPEVSRDAIPGDAQAVRLLRARVQQAAKDPAPALIIGETGVGKEFCAREIHRLSGRRGPFVGVNVAELTHELIESQLFGHEKGAFTGADRAQPGLFRAADGGTLFLDEIGELPLELQPKLLRALQEGEVRPVGQTKSIKVDVRVVAATHRMIGLQVERDQFRRDLYARLAFWELDVPPLRRRKVDLLAWTERLRQAFATKRGQAGRPFVLDALAVEALLLHPWLENLRGLDRVVHRLATEQAGKTITADVLHTVLPQRETSTTAVVPPPPILRGAEKVDKLPAPTTADELAKVIAETGSVRATAKHYGRDRRQVYRWMEQLGLRDASAGDED